MMLHGDHLLALCTCNLSNEALIRVALTCLQTPCRAGHSGGPAALCVTQEVEACTYHVNRRHTCALLLRSGSSAFSTHTKTDPASLLSQGAIVSQSVRPDTASSPCSHHEQRMLDHHAWG